MGTVLIADDDELCRNLLATKLREAGHRVYEAHDGKEALDFFVAIAPHAVVTDLQMPRMDGHELIAELRKIGATIPIFVVSGGGKKIWQQHGNLEQTCASPSHSNTVIWSSC